MWKLKKLPIDTFCIDCQEWNVCEDEEDVKKHKNHEVQRFVQKKVLDIVVRHRVEDYKEELKEPRFKTPDEDTHNFCMKNMILARIDEIEDLIKE